MSRLRLSHLFTFLLLLCTLLLSSYAQRPASSSSSTSIPLLLTSSSSSSYNTSLAQGEALVTWLGLERHTWAQVVGGIFALIACLIALLHITATLQHNHNTELRRYVIRMLGLVPLYAALSWWALMTPSFTIYLDVARDAYESMVIFSFFQFILFYLGGTSTLEATLSLKEPVPHSWPLSHCLGSHWSMQHTFLFQTRLGVFQYVILKFVVAICTFISLEYDDGVEEAWSFTSPYLYYALINNLSQAWALYCLFLFYYATKDELKPIRPFYKFAAIKMVVFFTYWQFVLLSILTAAGVIPTTPSYSAATVSAALQDWLICLEMALFAVVHVIAFPAREFSRREGSDASALEDNAFNKIFQIIAPLDVAQNLHEINRGMERYHRVGNVSTETSSSLELSRSTSNNSSPSFDEKEESELRMEIETQDRRKKKRMNGKFADEGEPHAYSLKGIEKRIARVKEQVKNKIARISRPSTPPAMTRVIQQDHDDDLIVDLGSSDPEDDAEEEEKEISSSSSSSSNSASNHSHFIEASPSPTSSPPLSTAATSLSRVQSSGLIEMKTVIPRLDSPEDM